MSQRNGLSETQLHIIHQIYTPFDDAHIGVACIDAQGVCLLSNPQFSAILGFHGESLAGKPLDKICPPEHYEATKARLQALFNNQLGSYKLRRDLYKKNNEIFTASVCVSAIRDEKNQVIAAIIIISDVAIDTTHELELKKLSYAVENSGSAVLITNAEGLIEYTNPRFSEVTGYSPLELIGKKPSLLRSDQTSDHIYKGLWHNILSGKQWRNTLLNRRKDGSEYWSFQSISPIYDQNDTLVNIVSVSDDISHIKEHERQMEQLAYFDPLTALGNRRRFRDDLDNLIHKPAEQVSALLLLDLDHFKQINDTLGHDTGDELLMAIANRLRFCTSEASSVYRLGGDEFTVLVHTADSTEDLVTLTTEILSLLGQPLHIGPHEIQATVSIGITLIHTDGDDASGLLKNADLAMYEAKRSGRNTFAFFHPKMDLEAKRALSLELDLRHAIDHEALHLLYQPIMDLRTGRVVAVEALCRWCHLLDGDIEPSEFIEKAEETGLILPLGRWVIKEALAMLIRLLNNQLPTINLSINLSTRQLEDPLLIPTFKALIEEHPSIKPNLTLEITEGVLLQNPQQSTDTLHALKQLGISLAIDDFGTGFSSLNYLKKMPVDILKIDKSFIADLPHDEDSAAITETIIAMAERLQLTPLAEGIETLEQKQFLISKQCFLGQGFLYSKAITEAQLFEMLAKQQDH